MADDTEGHVKSCKACARRKARYSSAKVPIQEYEAPILPWDRAHIDLTGPFEPSKEGNRYIVVVKDALTRYVETMPVKKDTATEVAAALIKLIIYRHGCVRQIVSDGGREFDNKLWKNVAQLLNIRHSIICPFNPRSNGLAENHMRTMKDALAIYCEELQEDWDEHLAGISMSYNMTVNSQTGYTPFFMIYGREATMPSEAWLTNYAHGKEGTDYVDNLVKVLTQVWSEATVSKKDEIKKIQKDQKPTTYREFSLYEVGDYAMVESLPKLSAVGWVDYRKKKLTQKLQSRFSGPYRITKRSPL